MPCPIPSADLDHVLEHSRSWWAPRRGARVLVTGATGFFGRWLLESFAHVNDRLSLGMQAGVLSRDLEAFARRAPALAARRDLILLRGDVRHFAPPVGPWDLVLHAAATSSRAIDDLEMSETVVNGTRHVLEWAHQAGVQRLLMVSSGAVYGRLEDTSGPISEDHPSAADLTQQDGAYARSKRLAEQLTLQVGANTNLEVSIARCFAFVGPHLPLDGHFAIGNFMAQALRDGDIHLAGDGSAVRTYMHAADLALWLWGLLLQAPNLGIYNVGSSEPIRMAELARLVLHLTGGDPRRVVLGNRPPSTEARPYYVPCVRRAQELLGLRASLPLADSIARTLTWISQAERRQQGPLT